MNRITFLAPIIVRIGMALVFLWFGWNQIMNPSLWTGYVPGSVASLLNGNSTLLVLLNGWFEIVAGAALLVGLQVRLVSLLLGLHLIAISSSLGISAIGVRDIGLSLATLSIFFAGPDRISLDWKFLRMNRTSPLNAPNKPYTPYNPGQGTPGMRPRV